MLRWVRVAPFGKPVVPDVYWMLIGSSGPRRERRSASASALTAPVPATSSSQSSSQKNIARSRPGQLGGDLLDHVHVVGRLERRGGEQHPAARLVEGVRQLVGAVGRVDVDQHDADLGGGVLQQRPLGVVRAPQARPGRRPPGPAPSARVRSARRARRSRRTSSAGPGGGRRAPRAGRGRRPCGRGWRRSSRRAAGHRSVRHRVRASCAHSVLPITRVARDVKDEAIDRGRRSRAAASTRNVRHVDTGSRAW